MQQHEGYKELSQEELNTYRTKKQEGEYVLMDVRQSVEYDHGHIPGAVWVPMDRLDAYLQSNPPAKEHVFYCRSGNRSGIAARKAADAQTIRAELYSLEGGIKAREGMLLEGFPRPDAFPRDEDPAVTLYRALEMEKAAALFYTKLLNTEISDKAKELVEKLVDVETSHAKVIFNKMKQYGYKTEYPESDSFDHVFHELKGDILEGGKNVAELQPWIDAAQESSESRVELAELALLIEYHAFDLYRVLADRRTEQGEKNIFLSLAEQEKRHAQAIIEHLDEFMR